MTTCFICNNELKVHNNRHVYYCAKINNLSHSKDEVRYEQIAHEIGTRLTQQDMYNLYITEEWSLPDFSSHFGLNYGNTQFLLKYFEISARNISESKRTKKAKNKFETTNIERYGHANPSSNDVIKQKKAITFLEHYGVDNVRKSDWFRSWYEEYMIATFGKKSTPNRYGNMQRFWDSKTTEEKQLHMIPANNGYVNWYSSLTKDEKVEYNRRKAHTIVQMTSSSLEVIVSECLAEHKIPFISQFWIAQRSYDFRILGTNILIEVNGDYWHANPFMYEAVDLINYPGETITAEERWNRDIEKTKLAEKYGYAVLTLWETDINNNLNQFMDWVNPQIDKLKGTK